MKTNKSVIKNALKNEKVRESYNAEKMLADVAIRIQVERQKLGLSQTDLAKKAHLKQQQISAIENGANPTLRTVFQVCEVLKLKVKLA